MTINDVTGQTVDAAMKVHSTLGPGLLESAYKVCLAHELRKRGLEVRTEFKLSGHCVGLLINFHVTRLRDGIKRMVNGL
jgi:hypothetical protein